MIVLVQESLHYFVLIRELKPKLSEIYNGNFKWRFKCLKSLLKCRKLKLNCFLKPPCVYIKIIFRLNNKGGIFNMLSYKKIIIKIN